MIDKIRNKDLAFYFPAWFCFTWFVLFHFVLTYIFISLTLKIWVFFIGIFLPILILLSNPTSSVPYKLDHFPLILEDLAITRLSNKWPFLALTLFAAIIRFWNIGTLNRWPNGDSSLLGLSVIQWMNHFQWKPFVTLSQVPSTISYLFFFAAKLTGSFLIGLQLPSSLISLLTVCLAYFAARLYLPQSLALILCILVGINEWDLLLSQCAGPAVFLPFWEWGIFYVLGRLIISPSSFHPKIWACLLGFTLGTGPYTFMAWPVFAVLVLGIAIGWFWKKHQLTSGGLFLLFFFLALSPFITSLFQNGYGGHLQDVAAWNNPSFSWIGQFQICISYIQSIFWGTTNGIALPPSGGFLNALLGSFFLLGLVEVYHFRKSLFFRFLLFALLFFLLPGFLSKDLEADRILLVLPILLIFVSFGIQTLLISFPQKFQLSLLIFILGLSAVMDLNRLFKPSEYYLPPLQQTGDSNEYRADFRILQSLDNKKGPGWIFTDMIPDTLDYSLAYCSYPFNAAWNPGLGQKVKWAALFTESHYRPFISKVFPTCQWIIAQVNSTGMTSRHALGLMEITPDNRNVLAKWQIYYAFQQNINLETVDTPTGMTHQAILEKMMKTYTSLPEDPFIQSCYFEKLAYNYSWEKTFHPEDTWTCWKNFTNLFQNSFLKSYQDIELCEKYGRLLALENQKTDAKQIFKKLLDLSPGNPWLETEIQELGLGS